jgi:hypothetical protein
MRKLFVIAGLSTLLFGGGCAPTNVVSTPQIYDPVDAVQQYTQRADKITLTAGNADAVNIRVQEVDPWPRYVGDKQIAANGERMAGAVERYRDVSKIKQVPAPLGIQSTGSGGGGGSGGQ